MSPQQYTNYSKDAISELGIEASVTKVATRAKELALSDGIIAHTDDSFRKYATNSLAVAKSHAANTTKVVTAPKTKAS